MEKLYESWKNWKIIEISWNFVDPEKWEPVIYTGKI